MCVFVCVYANASKCEYICVPAYTHLSVSVGVCTCLCMCVCPCVYLSMCGCLCVCLYVCALVRGCLCLFARLKPFTSIFHTFLPQQARNSYLTNLCCSSIIASYGVNV